MVHEGGEVTVARGSELGAAGIPIRRLDSAVPWHGNCSAKHYEGREAVMPVYCGTVFIANHNSPFILQREW